MIPKAQILELSRNYELQPTTVEKDYVLGWLLRTISLHPELSKWVFKGGTCLKKCYFETYRFSEDLDYTLPIELEVNKNGMKSNLHKSFITNRLTYLSISGQTFIPKWEVEL